MPLQMRGGTGGIISAIESGNADLTLIEAQTNLTSGHHNTSAGLGLMTDVSRISITGHRKTITSASFLSNSSTVPNNSLDISYPTVASNFYVASTSTDDAGGGTGATAILMTGLDEDWEPIAEQIVLTGQTPVATVSAVWWRVNAIQVIGVGSGGVNAGTISVTSANDFTAGVPQSAFVSGMEIGTNLCFQGHYSIRAGYSFMSTVFKFSTDATSSKPLELRASFGTTVGATIIQYRGVELTTDGNFNYIADGFQVLPEKTDIQVFSKAKTTTVDMATVFWSGLLFKTATYPNAS